MNRGGKPQLPPQQQQQQQQQPSSIPPPLGGYPYANASVPNISPPTWSQPPLPPPLPTATSSFPSTRTNPPPNLMEDYLSQQQQQQQQQQQSSFARSIRPPATNTLGYNYAPTDMLRVPSYNGRLRNSPHSKPYPYVEEHLPRWNTQSPTHVSSPSNGGLVRNGIHTQQMMMIDKQYPTHPAPVPSATTPSSFRPLLSKDPVACLPGTDPFGLLGLLGLIRMTDPDMNSLSLGTDLTTLGLNLNSPEVLYTTFVSPFADTPSHPLQNGSTLVEPEFHLPPCYTVPLYDLLTASKLASFSDETLFYIFYAMPRDLLQAWAAMELYKRHWRFHKDLKMWLTKYPVGNESYYERGVFIFFDVVTWEKTRKEYTLYYDCLEEKEEVGMPRDGDPVHR